MIGLTHMQAATLAFIQRYMADNDGVCPSFQEIADEIGMASKSGVHRIVTALEERGCIRRPVNRWRSIEVLPPEPPLEGLAAYSSASLIAELSRRSNENRGA